MADQENLSAEGALAEVNNNLTRMRELAIQASNGTLNTGDREAVDNEFQELISEIDRISAERSRNTARRSRIWSITPKRNMSWAVIFMPLATSCALVPSRHRIEDAASGEITL